MNIIPCIAVNVKRDNDKSGPRKEKGMKYTLIRSRRRTLALEIRPDGSLVVRSPLYTPLREIDALVSEKRDWIERCRRLALERAEKRPQPTEEDEARCRALAREKLPGLIERYAPLVGAYPAGVTVTGAASRFGSCSAKNRVCFSWRLFLYPMECAEYVVVHELCHILHHDHSPAFWREVARVMPDYERRQRILRGLE